MGEENPIEKDEIKLERFKVWGKIITAAITVLFGSAIAAYINYQIQTRQLDQQKLLNEAELKLQKSKAEADQRQAEMVYLGQFLEHALTDDIKKRIRFAEYFSTLTISGDLRDKWEVYHKDLVALDTAAQESKKELEKALQAGETEKARLLETEVAQQQAQVQAIPEKSDIYFPPTKTKRFLDENWRPRNYTNNEYELQSDGKVVYDKATGLMWQQSGSKDNINFGDAKNYIATLNSETFAGYNNWRLPTLEEAKSLLEPKRNETNNLYIDPIFDEMQTWIRTSDQYSASSAWVVLFYYGLCSYDAFYGFNVYVRAVR